MLCEARFVPREVFTTFREFFDHANLLVIQGIEFGRSGPRKYFLEQIFS